MSNDLILAEKRWNDLELLQDHYDTFVKFLYDVQTELMGFQCTDIQTDIALFLEHGSKYRMIQAQRGQAKTTITACYAVWRLIHDPTTRVLIVSAGSPMAAEISKWIIQIIMFMPELECLRPDPSHGDRQSIEAFDVHWQLKGAEKSPSIACMGISSSIQGRRADVLIADDVESKKNSRTAVQRELLLELTRDFTSICSSGDIIYLGTPQSSDSIYNTLPSRGFEIRIWTGRYPTEEEEANYGNMLAPLIRKRMEDDPTLRTGGGTLGNRGKPTDPVLLNEEKLMAKELDQGQAYFQLQHMLDTKLADAERYPLKLHDIVFMKLTDTAPLVINWGHSNDNLLEVPTGFPIQERMYKAFGFGKEYGDYQGTHMYVDPAGGGSNGDETAYAITKSLAGRIFVVDVGSVAGGIAIKSLEALTDIAVKYKPDVIHIEENFGKGALSSVWTPLLLKKHTCSIEDIWENTQKEARIIDTLEPIIGSQRLVIDIDLIKKDWVSVQQYPAEKRSSYSLFFQIARITRDKGSLYHDDRLDALAGSCRYWTDYLRIDADKEHVRVRQDNYNKLISDPLGNGRSVPSLNKSGAINQFNRWRS